MVPLTLLLQNTKAHAESRNLGLANCMMQPIKVFPHLTPPPQRVTYERIHNFSIEDIAVSFLLEAINKEHPQRGL